MAQKLAQPVRIEDPDEPFLKQAGEIAFEFINLRTQSTISTASSVKKAPHFPKKAAGEPGLLRAEESEPEASQAELELLPASLPQLGAGGQQGGQQQQQQQQTTQAQATGHQEQATGLQLATGQRVSSSRLIAERLRLIGDEVEKDIIDEQTRMAFSKLFSHNVSAFTMRREDFTSTCASILSQFQQFFPSGWHQISLVYHAMFQAVLSVREEGGEVPTETREQQVANYVGPTLTDLGLAEWMASHGGMDNFGSQVEGEGAKAVVIESSVDPKS